MDFAYRFPAVKGRQASRDYYVAMLPLRVLPKIFSLDEDCVQPEYRAQRRLNEQRIPEISSYILDNPDTYVFSALAASIDGDIEFVGGDSNGLGILEVSLDAAFLINDGQHRTAALLEALKESPHLGDETISVVFYEDAGLERSQQIFTDLNKHAVRTSNSISELYDYRDGLAVATRAAIAEVPFLNTYTNKEKDNLGKLSASLFTLNMFYKANKRILGRGAADEAFSAYITSFWKSVCEHMRPWTELENGHVGKLELKEETISTQAVLIQALGRVGHSMRQGNYPLSRLDRLELVNWSRSAPCWKLRTISDKGRIITSETGICLTANVIKSALGIDLLEDEKTREEELVRELTKAGAH